MLRLATLLKATNQVSKNSKNLNHQIPKNNFFSFFNKSDNHKLLGINSSHSKIQIKTAYQSKVNEVKRRVKSASAQEKELRKLRMAYEAVMREKGGQTQSQDQQQQSQNFDNQNQSQQSQTQYDQNQQNMENEDQKGKKSFTGARQNQTPPKKEKFEQKVSRWLNLPKADPKWKKQGQPGSKKSALEFGILAISGTILLCAIAGFSIKDYNKAPSLEDRAKMQAMFKNEMEKDMQQKDQQNNNMNQYNQQQQQYQQNLNNNDGNNNVNYPNQQYQQYQQQQNQQNGNFQNEYGYQPNFNNNQNQGYDQNRSYSPSEYEQQMHYQNQQNMRNRYQQQQQQQNGQNDNNNNY